MVYTLILQIIYLKTVPILFYSPADNSSDKQTLRTEIYLMYSNEKGTYLPKQPLLKEDSKPEEKNLKLIIYFF